MEDISRMEEDEVVKVIMTTLKEYVDEFYEKVTLNCSIPSKGISPRYITSTIGDQGDFIMDYFVLRPTYSKQNAKDALQIFNKYCDTLTLYLDVLKFEYKNIEYYVDKTGVSSSRIGKSLYVYNFPFKLPDEHYCKPD